MICPRCKEKITPLSRLTTKGGIITRYQCSECKILAYSKEISTTQFLMEVKEMEDAKG